MPAERKPHDNATTPRLRPRGHVGCFRRRAGGGGSQRQWRHRPDDGPDHARVLDPVARGRRDSDHLRVQGHTRGGRGASPRALYRFRDWRHGARLRWRLHPDPLRRDLMAAPEDESVLWDALSVGATRPAVIRGLNVPFWFVLPIIGLPMVIVAVTRNPIWLLLIIALTALGRWVVSRDHNRPRVLYLALISGALFADRRRWGGDSVDPLGEGRHGE